MRLAPSPTALTRPLAPTLALHPLLLALLLLLGGWRLRLVLLRLVFALLEAQFRVGGVVLDGAADQGVQPLLQGLAVWATQDEARVGGVVLAQRLNKGQSVRGRWESTGRMW